VVSADRDRATLKTIFPPISRLKLIGHRGVGMFVQYVSMEHAD